MKPPALIVYETIGAAAVEVKNAANEIKYSPLSKTSIPPETARTFSLGERRLVSVSGVITGVPVPATVVVPVTVPNAGLSSKSGLSQSSSQRLLQ
ncbi:hypothetical protein [Priestia megaterium]|uniref:hypothetical protein n=1 Tax=Priestia megaterium TaxID=1404 RepID=UPI0012DC5212